MCVWKEQVIAQIILTSFEFNWNSNLTYVNVTITQRGFLLLIVVIQCGIRRFEFEYAAYLVGNEL